MGANVADFTVIEDRVFTLDSSPNADPTTREFNFRGGFLRDLEGILTFVVNESDNLRLHIRINRTEVVDANIANGTFPRTIQEVFSMRTVDLNPVGTQVASFTADRGRGSISDVIVWYRRNSE